jgi:peptide/nickel transport system substrate-binding protein
MTAYGATESVPSGEIVPGSILNWAYEIQTTQHLPYLGIQLTPYTIQIYDTLFYFKDGKVDKLTGLLAKEWTPDADRLGYTIKLHDNVKFTNGTPLTAQSCVDCWKYTAKYMPSFFSSIERIDAVDDHTLYFKFNKPFAAFMVYFADTITGIVDPTAIKQYGDNDNRAAIGSGPYKIERYVAGEVLVFKANENYWFAPKMPQVETVNMYYIPDTNTALTALEAGEVDYYETQYLQSYYNMRDLPGIKVQTIEANQNTVWVNEKRAPVLGKLEVRKALGMLIDWQSICDMIYDGIYYPAKGLWKHDTIAAAESPYYVHDPKQGLALLKEAGVDPSSISLEFLCYPKYEDIGVSVQSQLAQYGIKIKVNSLESSTVNALERNGGWDLRVSWNSYTAANPLAGFMNGVQKAGNQRAVFFEDCDPEAFQKVEAMYADAVAAKTMEEQGRILLELTEYLHEKCAAVGGFQIIKWAGLSDRFTNLIYSENTAYSELCYLRIAK